MEQLTDFKALGLGEQMLAAVKAKGFETPTAIQKLTIPRLLTQSNDIIAQSQTGTGKTAAYGLPILQELEPKKGAVQAIILVPTRELALQASEELISCNSQRRLSITAIYGGAAMSEQLRRLAKGVDIVVGTPGRVLDHIHRGTLKLDQVRFLVLDEADEMLNMGFIDDVEEIMSNAADDRRVMLFSATMPQRIIKLAERYMRDTEVVKVEAQPLTTDLTDQIYFEVREGDKFDALTRIIDIVPDFYGIVFSRTKVGVDEMVNKLLERGYAAEGLHGDVSQAQREKILRKFKNKAVNILVATDVAARGIDVNNLTHVINYSLPQDSESYVHRIGRTGRAGNQGTAITFISNSEMRQFGWLKRDINVEIKKETLPSAQDIVTMKRNKILTDLQEIIDNDTLDNYVSMSLEILEKYAPEQALSALLRLAFRSELDEKNYPEIRSFSVDRKGTARIFIAVGRKDGYSARSLTEMLKGECGMEDRNIDDVRVFDNYSFVSVPFRDAENIVHKLNGMQRGERPLAEIAKPEGGKERDERPRRSPRAGGEGGGYGRGRREGAPRGEFSDRKPRREYAKRDDDFKPRRSAAAGDDYAERKPRREYAKREDSTKPRREGAPREERVVRKVDQGATSQGWDNSWDFDAERANAWSGGERRITKSVRKTPKAAPKTTRFGKPSRRRK